MEKASESKKPDLKKIGKRAKQTAAGAALAASLFFGGLFSSPADIVKPEAETPSQGVVMTAELPSYSAEPAVVSAQDESKRGFRDRVRAWVKSLPLAVRLLFVLPCWAVGFGLIWLATALAGLMNVPVIGTILKIVLGALILFGLIILAEKLIFPDIPLKKLLSKHNIAALGITSLVIAAAGALGGLFWKDKPYLTAVIDISAAALYVAFLLIFVKKPKQETT